MTRWILSIMAFIASLALGAQRSPVVYDVTAITSVRAGGINLMGGKQLNLGSAWTASSQILFEDKLPNANWEHAAAFKILDAQGRLVKEITVKRPPLGLEKAPVISGSVPKANAPEFKLKTFDGKFKVADPNKYFAVLINGMANERHWNDFSFLYRTLTQIYGYKKENILIADGSFKESQPDLDGDGTPDIKYNSDKAGIKSIMKDMAEKMKDGNGHLVLAINDHGGGDGGESTIVTMDGEMKASEFLPLLNAIKAEKVLSLYEQCFSGGFVRGSTGPSHVSMAAARNDESSWGSSDGNWDTWIYGVIAGFAMQTHDGKSISVDVKGDGKISAIEAFGYSLIHDDASESPLLEANPNSGEGASMGLGF